MDMACDAKKQMKREQDSTLTLVQQLEEVWGRVEELEAGSTNPIGRAQCAITSFVGNVQLMFN